MSAISGPWATLLEAMAAGMGSWLVAIVCYGALTRMLMIPFQRRLQISAARLAGLEPRAVELREHHTDDAQAREDALVALYAQHHVTPWGPLGWIVLQALIAVWLLWGVLQASAHAPAWVLQDASSHPAGIAGAVAMGIGVFHLLTGHWPRGLRRSTRSLVLRLFVAGALSVLVSYSSLLIVIFLGMSTMLGIAISYVLARFPPRHQDS